jgi:ribonuclease R
MNSLQKQIVKAVEENKLEYKSFNQFFIFLSKTLKETPEDVAKAVKKLLNEGVLIEKTNRHLGTSKKAGLRKGIIIGNQRGFAFIKPITEFGKTSKKETDLFISPNKLFGALDNDIVLYREEPDKSAAVVKILERGNANLIGKVVDDSSLAFKRKKIEGDGLYVLADNNKFNKPIFISKRELKEAKIGDKVEVELTFQPSGEKKAQLIGKVKRILKNDSDIENGLISILCEHQIPDIFPEKVLQAAELLKTNFEKEKSKRVDLTKELIVTIDGEDAKDFDDAISIKKIPEGYVLGVHIADVGEYVTYGSEIDKEAFLRGTSVYFPDRVYPMLPERISNFLCSLRPNEEKLALSVEMTLDNFGVVKSYKIFESVIKSTARLTYNQVFDVINKNKKDESKLSEEFPAIKDEKIKKKLFLMNELSEKISQIRAKEGMLDFEIPETYFELDGKNIVNVYKRERNAAHKLIENFMILCNQVVAKHFCLIEAPFVYRVHEAPAKTRISEVVEALNGLGLNIKFPGKVSSQYVQEVLKKLKGTDIEEVGNKILLRAMEKAMYLEKCLGHFGLALEYYCHFTSPIRRYPDLTIHRIIKRVCKASQNNIITNEHISNNAIRKMFRKDYDLEDFVADSAFKSSDRELKADEAERDADDLFKAKFMQNKIGEEFDAKISGVSNFGVFIELENTIEGLVKLENLPEDDYKFDDVRLVLKGRHRRFTIGDKVKAVLINVNLTTRKIEFSLNVGKKVFKQD